MASTRKTPNTVRRSVALPRRLAEEAAGAAPPEISGNLNRIVTVALEEFVARRKHRDFERRMAEMAADPQVRKQSEAIAKEFASAESDGIED
jgi:hypothetical protein